MLENSLIKLMEEYAEDRMNAMTIPKINEVNIKYQQKLMDYFREMYTKYNSI